MSVLRWLLVAGLALAALVAVASYFGWWQREAAGAAAVEYTCPMHPTFVSDQQVPCPICGMDLVVRKPPEAAAGAAATKYTCPMHPQIVQDKPGSCPICHMDLVPMAAPGKAGAAAAGDGFRLDGIRGIAPVTISLERLQRIGLQTEAVRQEELAAGFDVPATVEADEAAVTAIAPRMQATLVEAAAVRVGEAVAAGAWLATVHAPELQAAQAEYLAAQVATAALGGEATRGISVRLQALGVSQAGIRRLGSRGRADGLLRLSSPLAGTVLQRNANPGQAVGPGTPVFLVGKLDRVLLVAEVPVARGGEVQVGQAVTFTAPGLKPVQAFVTTVESSLRAAAQTMQVRSLVANADASLRPGLLGRMRLSGTSRQVWTVPEESVIDTGTAQYVMRQAAPGQLVPTRIERGVHIGARVEVRAGLHAGDLVVTRGAFLVDAEARIVAGSQAVGMAAEPSPTMPAGHKHGGQP